MVMEYRGKPLSHWAKLKGLNSFTIWRRIKNGLPDELILAKKCSAPKPNHISSVPPDEVANDYEAWSDLTAEQLETMRDFEQLRNIYDLKQKLGG